jgi:hypothetical protein
VNHWKNNSNNRPENSYFFSIYETKLRWKDIPSRFPLHYTLPSLTFSGSAQREDEKFSICEYREEENARNVMIEKLTTSHLNLNKWTHQLFQCSWQFARFINVRTKAWRSFEQKKSQTRIYKGINDLKIFQRKSSGEFNQRSGTDDFLLSMKNDVKHSDSLHA